MGAKVLLDDAGNIINLLINPQPSIQGVVEIPDNDPRIAVFEAAHSTVIPAVTKRQILLWLYQNLGKTDADIQTAIQTIPDPNQSAIALIEWQYPDGPFSRSNQMFDELAPIFGLTAGQVDQAFVKAATF